METRTHNNWSQPLKQKTKKKQGAFMYNIYSIGKQNLNQTSYFSHVAHGQESSFHVSEKRSPLQYTRQVRNSLLHTFGLVPLKATLQTSTFQVLQGVVIISSCSVTQSPFLLFSGLCLQHLSQQYQHSGFIVLSPQAARSSGISHIFQLRAPHPGKQEGTWHASMNSEWRNLPAYLRLEAGGAVRTSVWRTKGWLAGWLASSWATLALCLSFGLSIKFRFLHSDKFWISLKPEYLSFFLGGRGKGRVSTISPCKSIGKWKFLHTQTGRLPRQDLGNMRPT